MKTMDRLLRRWRIAKAEPFIRPGDRLLDVGCFDRSLLERVRSRVGAAVGIDPLATPSTDGSIRIVRGTLPTDHPFSPGEFDCITMLAVLEHIREPDAVARECARLLSPGGRVIITVPRPAVDHILAILTRVRLIDGMSLEEHHGFDPAQTGAIFGRAGFGLLTSRGFQLGLNRLLVFERPAAQGEPRG